MLELGARLDRSRFDVKIACFHKEGAWLGRAEAIAPVAEFPIDGFARVGTLRQAAAFARWCRRERIGVVQTADFYANVFALPAAALAGVAMRAGSRRELNPDKTSGRDLTPAPGVPVRARDCRQLAGGGRRAGS